MIDYIHEMCQEWGDYMRRNPKCWPAKSMTWRLWMEQGATSQNFGPTNPDWTMREDAGEIHAVWRGMPEDLRSLMWLLYVKRNWKYEEKARRLSEATGCDVSRSKLFEMRSNLHYFILGRLKSQRPDDAYAQTPA